MLKHPLHLSVILFLVFSFALLFIVYANIEHNLSCWIIYAGVLSVLLVINDPLTFTPQKVLWIFVMIAFALPITLLSTHHLMLNFLLVSLFSFMIIYHVSFHRNYTLAGMIGFTLFILSVYQ